MAAQIAQASDAEVAFWESVRDSDDPAELEAYLERYPTGHFAALARLRIKKLSGVAPAATEERSAAGSAEPRAVPDPEPQECDWRAAHPGDPGRRAKGVLMDLIEAGPAVAACKRAVEAFPDVARFHYQFSRALFRAKRPEDASAAARRAIDLGYAAAQCSPAAINQGFKKEIIDWETAVSLCRDSAEQGLALGQHLLGSLYYNGDGVPQDREEWFRWVRLSAEQGYHFAEFSVGWAYQRGEGTQADSVEAARWYGSSSEKGNSLAQYQLGYMLERGAGIAKDQREAARWYREAAEQGHMTAQDRLARMYFSGRGVAEDDVEAVRWLRAAADQGLPGAQERLARAYENGHGVAEDLPEAERWYRKAAEQGHTQAQANLGYLYLHGKGVTKNTAEALRWIRKAVEQDNASAQGHLGWMHGKGEGVEKDQAQAVYWFREAAKRGNRISQYNLARRLARGRGVGKDRALAIAWYRQAANNGYKKAKTALKDLRVETAKVSRDEVRAVQRSLTQSGFDTGGADGVFGPRSRRALEAYQKDRALTADGDLSPDMAAFILIGIKGRTLRTVREATTKAKAPAPAAAPEVEANEEPKVQPLDLEGLDTF